MCVAQRLADRCATDERRYGRRLFTIVLDEMLAKTQAGSSSCTKGLLWLKRWVGGAGSCQWMFNTMQNTPLSGSLL